MANWMNVRTEVWPVAADEAGIWLVSGTDGWRSDPVDSDQEPHSSVEYELSRHDADDSVQLLHSTSWRADGPHVILTYIAVLNAGEPVLSRWPEAMPISPDLLEVVGNPEPGPAIDPPAPRYVDVLLHAIRHLRFLLTTDANARAALNETWRRHLNSWEPALAGMYDRTEAPHDISA